MSDQAELRTFSLSGIVERCARETERFFQRLTTDPRFCFELFRRAFAERCQPAWEAVHSQYCPQVAGWVRQHPAYPASGEEVQYFSNRAFEKMWAAVTPAKFPRFPDLKSLLRYLQMCVHSVLLDHVRAAEVPTVDYPVEVLAGEANPGASTVEDQALDRAHRRAFWEAIDARLHSEQERRVVYGSFVLALKPRELYAQSPDLFRDVGEVYRVKENVMARLRRDAELARFLGQDA